VNPRTLRQSLALNGFDIRVIQVGSDTRSRQARHHRSLHAGGDPDRPHRTSPLDKIVVLIEWQAGAGG
jgi:hypothetical protein